ncbi:MAG: cation:proton antiporter [Maricaulaceae bacterium]
MTLNLFLIFGAVFFTFSLVSKRIQGTILTPPILFTIGGLILARILTETAGLTYNEGGLHTLAELTLILVLAADSSQISLSELRKMKAIPVRLLSIALPLIIVTGTIVGYIIFPDVGWYQAALIAAILAPTDAALGASVLAEKSLPLKIRQGLNVESGLNDGIALPAVLFFACFLNMTHQTGEENWLLFLSLQVIIGPIAGVAVGWIGGHLIAWAAKKGWMTSEFQGVAAIALAVLAFAVAETCHGNGFIAAFVAGLTYGNLHVNYSKFLHEFTETESQFLSYLTFFLFGALILPEAIPHITGSIVLYAVLSLTLVRMLPVALSMTGMKLGLATTAFLGWFGPRGLASLLFGLLILEDLHVEQAEFVQTVVATTVLLSIILHGVTAAPFGKKLGRAHSETELAN